jgi:hypothetical protein
VNLKNSKKNFSKIACNLNYNFYILTILVRFILAIISWWRNKNTAILCSTISSDY